MSVPKVCFINVNEYLSLKEKDKQLTYSGYKRSKVLQSFDKDLLKKNPIGAVNWMAELILSGALTQLLEKCVIFFMKNINISNPNLPTYILQEITLIHNLLDNYKGDVYAIANNQIFRNHMTELISILALSDKQRVENRIRCRDEQFDINLLRDKMEADGKYINIFWKNGDDKMAYIPFNEFKYHIHKTYNREKAVFWISWILELHKRSTKQKTPLLFAERPREGVNKRHHKYFVWLLWDIIIREAEDRDDDELCSQIYAIHKLYSKNFAKRHITSRLSYILCAVLYVTQTIPTIKYTKKICTNYDVLTFINIQINVVFKSICNKYQVSKKRVEKKVFYKKVFPNLICEMDENINIFSRKKRDITRVKPYRSKVEKIKIKLPEPKPDIKYLEQVSKIANFQYNRS